MTDPSLPLLRGPFLNPSHGKPKQLVILMHGLGADGNDLFALSDELAEYLPDAAFIFPNAPEPCDMAPFGYQWFSLRDWSEASMYEGVCRTAPIVNHFIDSQKASLGLEDKDVALVGFSQGTMTALHTALRRPQALAGIVGFSGALVAPQKLAAELRSKPPVCLIHGIIDPVVPFAAMGLAEAALRGAGIAVEAHARPMLPHGIDPEGIRIAGEFLRKAFTR